MPPTEPAVVLRYLARRCFVEAAYFGTLSALRTPAAETHLLAGAACCGCIHPLAVAQRIFEGEPVADDELSSGGLRITPASELPCEGFFHLVQAFRLDHEVKAAPELHGVLDSIAADLVFVSRRELERPPGSGRRYTLSAASLAAAVLLVRLTANPQGLAGVARHKLEYAREMIAAELARTDGDAMFFAS